MRALQSVTTTSSSDHVRDHPRSNPPTVTLSTCAIIVKPPPCAPQCAFHRLSSPLSTTTAALSSAAQQPPTSTRHLQASYFRRAWWSLAWRVLYRSHVTAAATATSSHLTCSPSASRFCQHPLAGVAQILAPKPKTPYNHNHQFNQTAKAITIVMRACSVAASAACISYPLSIETWEDNPSCLLVGMKV